jgi:hypothetical protein
MDAAAAPGLAATPPDPYGAVETLYHAFLTGLILSTVLHRGRAGAAELVYRTFRRQHLEKFLPGLKKLGLDRLPHAVACAQYHYLANALGGVKVEYMPESDRKAWVRYVPPRWIYQGTAICGVPTEVSQAMLRAWHAHNGVSLGNPRLGFVCTKQTTDGQPGLEGYYYEYERDLAEHERLRFAPEEEGPDFAPERAPRAEGAEWPAARLRKVLRNYAMDYVRSMLPALMDLFGPESGGALGRRCAKLIGMQYYDETARQLGISGRGAAEFGEYLTRLGRAQDDEVAWEPAGAAAIVIRQRGWRLMSGVNPSPPELFAAWNGLWEGALAVHNRHLRLSVTEPPGQGRETIEWTVTHHRAQ